MCSFIPKFLLHCLDRLVVAEDTDMLTYRERSYPLEDDGIDAPHFSGLSALHTYQRWVVIGIADCCHILKQLQ